jgi:hypothetical protein
VSRDDFSGNPLFLIVAEHSKQDGCRRCARQGRAEHESAQREPAIKVPATSGYNG